MKEILDFSAGKTEINCLMIQPSYCCTGRCSGCYVKARGKLSKRGCIPYSQYKELLDRFCFNKEGCLANQISISIDNPAYYQGDNYLEEYLDIEKYSDGIPNIHLTVHSPSILQLYDNNWQARFASMISFSHIDKKDYLFLDGLMHLVSINWNLQVPDSLLDISIDTFEEHLEHVSSVYLLLPKDNTNGEVKTSTSYYDSLEHLAKIAEDSRAEVHLDNCYLARQEGCCSAGISTSHVWPDGSVTGCPYTTTDITGPADTVDDIVANIHKVRQKRDQTFCRILDKQ